MLENIRERIGSFFKSPENTESANEPQLSVVEMKEAPPMPPVKGGAKQPSTTAIGVDDFGLYSTNDFQPWNPDLLLTVKGHNIYKKMMRDDQVKAAMDFKINAVVSRNWYFDVKEKNKQHEEMEDFFTTAIDKIKGSWSDNLLGILSGLINGFSITEKIYSPITWNGRSYWGLKQLKLRPAHTFHGGFKVNEHGDILSLKQRDQGNKEIEIPLDKVIHFVHQPHMSELYGESDLRACYPNWWSKDNIIKFQNIHLERHASGFIWATIRDDANLSRPQRNNLENLIKNITARMGALLPEGVELNVENPMQTKSYEQAIIQHNMAIARSLLVPNLLGVSEQGKTGSYSQSQTQLEAFFWVLELINNRLEEVLNEQLFKQLAIWNFGTDDFPRYRAEPMSDEQKAVLAERWADLVNKGAVTKGDSDEEHLRKLLGFPERAEGTSTTVNPMTALNGAQIDSLLKIVEEVRTGALPKESASQIIVQSFPMNEEQAKLILDPIEVQEEPEPGQEPDKGAKGLPEGSEGGEKGNKPSDDELEEMMRQRGYSETEIQREFARAPWIRRVDFKAIEKSMNDYEEKLASDLTDEMAKAKLAILRAVAKIWGERSGVNVKPNEIEGLKLPKEVVSSVRKVARQNLRDALNTAYTMAKSELPKNFAKNTGRMDLTKADKFLTSRAMKIAGVLDADVLKQVQVVLENGILYDKSLKEVINALETDTQLAAMLPATDAAGRWINVPHRLENIARTNTSYAWNQGRKALFSEPELRGFIKAFEYSAILDDRTTEVCASLHGLIRSDWEDREPPNHFMCRSLLIPVTIQDQWSGQDAAFPAKGVPQKGFA